MTSLSQTDSYALIKQYMFNDSVHEAPENMHKGSAWELAVGDLTHNTLRSTRRSTRPRHP